MKLIDNWWLALKGRWSVRIAAIYTALAAVLLSHQTLLVGLLAVIPDHGLVWWLSVFVVIVVAFVIPVATSLIAQPKLEQKIKEKTDA